MHNVFQLKPNSMHFKPLWDVLWNKDHFFNKRWNKAGNSWKKKVVLVNNMVSLIQKLCKSLNHFLVKK